MSSSAFLSLSLVIAVQLTCESTDDQKVYLISSGFGHCHVGLKECLAQRNLTVPRGSMGEMVIPPSVRLPRITKFLKPYVLKMHFTNKYVSAQLIHSPTANEASSASSQEKALRSSMESTRGVAAAAKIGKILGERLLLKEISAISVFLKREEKYHGKVKAGVKLL